MLRDELLSEGVKRATDKQLLPDGPGDSLSLWSGSHHCRSLVDDGVNVALVAVSSQLLGGVWTFYVMIQEVEYG